MKKECRASDIALWGFQMMHDYASYNPLRILAAEVGGLPVVAPTLAEVADQERPVIFSFKKTDHVSRKGLLTKSI